MTFPSVLRRAVCAGAFLLGLGATHQAHAATFTVTNTNDSGAGSLRQAILDANVASSDDTIVLDDSTFSGFGYIYVRSGVMELANNGTLTITAPLPQGPGASPSAALLGRGETPSGDNRIFKIAPRANVTLNNLQLSNASASASSDGNGGAINNEGTLTLNHCLFNSNSAPGGFGGAIFNSSVGTLIVNNGNFGINSTNNGAGGAICNSGTATINATVFNANRGDSGGAISNRGGTLIINTTSFTSNRSSNGGALTNSAGSTTINSSTFESNTAANGVGGAISNSSSLTVNNSTFAANSSNEGSGGALYSNAGTAVVDSSTFSGNSSGNGGGIFNDNTTLTLKNSIVAGNRADTGPNLLGRAASGDYNLVDDVAGATLSGTHNITGQPARLGALASNGGPTKTFLPQAGSPAIDAGNSTLPTDQRGEARPVDVASKSNAAGGNGSDIGAVEAADTAQNPGNLDYLVNTTDDHDDGACTAFDCTLREAVAVANSNPNTTFIAFDTSVFASAKTVDLVTPVTVTTPTVLSGIVAGGVTLRSTSGSTLINVLGGSLNVSGLTFTDAGVNGLSVYGATAAVISCTFVNCNNGIQNGIGEGNPSTLTVQNSTFYQNRSSAILSGSNNATNDTATVTNCTLVGNGYGLSVLSGTATLSNSIVVDNTNGNINNTGGTVSSDHNITTGTAAAAGLDPAGLKDNGGPTKTIALVAGSPAIDAANSSLGLDQRRRARPFDFPNVANASGGNGSDIGAYELNEAPQSGPNFVVNSTSVSDDGTCGPTNCTLREAINAANANPDASTITFDGTAFAAPATLTLPSNVNPGLPPITSDISIIGPSAPGSGVTIVNTLTNAGTSLEVRSGALNISNLTIQGGLVGIDILEGEATVTRCTFTDNFFGIRQKGNSLTVNNSTFVPVQGSGIDVFSQATINSTTITNGFIGIQIEGGVVNLSNSLVVGNQGNISSRGTLNDNGNNITTGTAAEAGLDPAGLKDNGGPTQTVALLPGSRAINKGATSLSTDQRGVTRDSKPDIGAYEFVNTAPSLDPAQLIGSVTVGTKEIFTLNASDADGATDIREMWLLINERLSWNAGATLIYVPSTSSPTSGLLYLRRGDAFLAPIQVGEGASSSAVLDNGAVRVVASEVEVTTSGNSITLKLPLTIRDGLVGNNRIFGRVVDSFGATDPASLAGDNGYIRLGTYTVAPQFSGGANSAPVLSRLTPGLGTSLLTSSGVAAAAQTFSFAVKDDNGSGDIESMWFLAGKQLNWTRSATFVYQPRSRRLYLRSDDGSTFLGGGRIGDAGILENSQVRVDLSQVKTTIYPDGKTVGLSLPLVAKSSLLGQNKVWLRAQDNQGATVANGDAQGYVLSGTWSVTQPTAPNSAHALSAGNS